MRNKNTRSGFSLVEAILATTILGIAVTGILTTFSAALMAAKVAENYSKASTMMNEVRGYLRADLFSPYEVNEGTFTLHEGFEWSASYMETDTSNLYQVTLTVAWNHGNRRYQIQNMTYHYYDIMQEELTAEE